MSEEFDRYVDYSEPLLRVQSLLKKQYDLMLHNRINDAESLAYTVIGEVKLLQNAILLAKERQQLAKKRRQLAQERQQ